MLAELYPISKGKNASLKDDVNAAIKSFCDKHGYKPLKIIIRHYLALEVQGLGLEVGGMISGVQVGHFMLGPVKEQIW